MKLNRTQNNKKRGAALVEYGLLIAGVALVTAAAVSIFGKKTNDLLGTAAAALPSSSVEDTGAITGGRTIMTTKDASGNIAINWAEVTGTDNTTDNLLGSGAGDLIHDLQND